jgi:hypothetical protein
MGRAGLSFRVLPSGGSAGWFASTGPVRANFPLIHYATPNLNQ